MNVLVAQTIVFTLVGIIFVVFLALFIVEMKRGGIFAKWFRHRPTKAERLQTQVDELQRQVDELKQSNDKQ
ncbi:MAG: hypothetical protein NC132_05555 [Corallococcus sp.]|nr:hypothetical protein [Corallococcus sp.]MCM1360002.1 hypothetical protein [Corallococcus sp.]MCM1395559.1 hypothetical protein [Corallococcus sp.]